MENMKMLWEMSTEYCEKYDVKVNNIKCNPDVNVEFFITVPEHSVHKSESGFELAGIYLANSFKSHISNEISKCSDLVEELSKLRVKVHYDVLSNSFKGE